MRFLVLMVTVGLAVAEPLAVLSSQYRYQDVFGNSGFGHVGGPNSREEVRAADGTTKGSYSYIDGNGLVQSAVYAADALNGFRIAATNLPVGPAVPASPEVVATAPVAAYAAAPALVAAAPTPYIAHHLGKRSVVALTANTLTSYPGSTAPLVPAAPTLAYVGAPASAYAAPFLPYAAGPVGAYAAAPAPAVAAIHPGSLNVPLDTPEVAITKSAQLIQQASEGTRNILGGGIPLALPADTHEVAAGKVAHAIAHARQTASVSGHYLKKRSLAYAAPAFYASPYAAIHPGSLNVPLDTPEVAITKSAQLVQQAQEGLRNNYGGIPVSYPADTPAVAITKNALLIQQASEGTRNVLGGGIPLALPADTHEVAAGKVAHAIAHAKQAAITSYPYGSFLPYRHYY